MSRYLAIKAPTSKGGKKYTIVISYLRTCWNRKANFSDAASAARHVEEVEKGSTGKLNVDILRDDTGVVRNPRRTFFRSALVTFGCPICAYKAIALSMSIYIEGEWKTIEGASSFVELKPTVSSPNAISEEVPEVNEKK